MGRLKIGEAVTDRNGKARFQYDIRNVHTDFAIEAVYDEYSKRKSIDNVTYTILLETDMCVDTGDPIEISGYLLEDDLPMNQEQLNVFLDDVRVKTVLVNSQDGSYSASLDSVADGTHSVYVTWNNNRVSSSVETVYVGTCVYEVSLAADKVTCDTLDSVTFSGVLTRNDVPWKNQPVEIYDGSTLIDTLTTDNNGAYSKTIEGLTAGNHIFKAVNTRCESDPLNITVNKTNPDLNIEVPLVLVYSDDFIITGLLTDKHNNGVNGKTVQLKVGSTVVDSGVTAKVDGVDGIVEFTQCPVHMGTHTFQLSFEGDATYNSIDSQTVTREINKETSVITVYTPLNGEEYYYDESIRVTGVLLSDDAEEIEGRTIKVTENGTLITTLTTESNGRFLGDITGLSIDTHSLKFEFEGDEYYTASSIVKSVDVIDYNYDIALSCSTPIIRVGDTATVIATLTKEHRIYPGQTLTYEIKHGDTVIDTGSDTTDLDGQIRINYVGTGIGDVDVNVTYTHLPTLLEQTYVLEDRGPWIVTNNIELDEALTGAIRDDIIYIMPGEYSITKSYNIPCIKISGDENNIPTITVGDNTNITTTSTESGINIFENIGFTGRTGGIRCHSAYASVEIRNCNWKNMVNQYNFQAIWIDNFTEERYVLIEDCEFINNYTTGYGHYCTSIDCIAPEGAMNLTVRNCIFNATRDNVTANLLTGNKYRVALNRKERWGNSLNTAPAVNCYFCNNQYLHPDDTLYGFESDECP